MAAVSSPGDDAAVLLARFAAELTAERLPPSTKELIVAKFLDCATHAACALPPNGAEAVVQMVEHLEDVADIRALPRLLGAR